jgi:hypothetical protein
MSILRISEFLTARVSKLQIAERESEEQREWERPESGNEQRAELLRPKRERRPASGRESDGQRAGERAAASE